MMLIIVLDINSTRKYSVYNMRI